MKMKIAVGANKTIKCFDLDVHKGSLVERWSNEIPKSVVRELQEQMIGTWEDVSSYKKEREFLRPALHTQVPVVPAVVGDRVFCAVANSIVCYDVEGKTIWTTRFNPIMESFHPFFYCGSLGLIFVVESDIKQTAHLDHKGRDHFVVQGGHGETSQPNQASMLTFAGKQDPSALAKKVHQFFVKALSFVLSTPRMVP